MITYHSITKGVWEPILEPVVNPKDDQLVMWFLKVEVSVCVCVCVCVYGWCVCVCGRVCMWSVF